ncbi:O-succinylbenzoate-CoA ligase [Cryobacterium arcticum]|uniref:O-succinylbenzoate-CoA ligase n=1 Tax=Cryobacterium arcticum TaxID=670052 RepID=A0A1B1BF48_9MICO|nr:AMP-binding protein [Cryobacterium arcticum]ANP71219.1 O-succinylbenzoate-CoA ligase [Cryobacterium arcticum]
MRDLRVVPVGDPLRFLAELRLALANDGPALLPVPAEPGAVASRGDLGRVPRNVSVVIETSGSTGRPKRVMLSTDALLASAAASGVHLGGDGQWLLALPAHYIAGVQVLVRSIAAGTEPVLLPPGHFDPAVFAAHAGRLTEPLRFTSLVPVQLARLLGAAPGDPALLTVLRRFTGILVGGQAVSAELIGRAEALGVRVVRTYGSSETAGGCVYDGAPIGNAVVRTVDGQLEISGSMLAEGYLADEDLTGERFVEHDGVRWYRTGDLGAVTPDGTVSVTGRADNVIISGGEKVSLDAVERLVRTLPGLTDACVVRAADAVWGEVPVVVVAAGLPAAAVNAAVVPELETVRGAVAAALGPAARPARLVTVPALPLLASGKPDRRALQARVGAAALDSGQAPTAD